MAACNIFRFSPLRDRRRLSSSAFSSAESVTRWRFVRNGINHSPTQMFLWYIYQQNAHLDGRWCIVDLLGKHGRVRTVPMPAWVKLAIDAWKSAASIVDGNVFRPVNRADRLSAERLGEKAIWQMLPRYAQVVGISRIAPHDARRTCAKLCRAACGQLEQIQLLLGHASVQTTERYLGTKQDLVHPPNDGIKLTLAMKQATNSDSRSASLKQ